VEKWLAKLYEWSEMPQTAIIGNKCDLEKVVDDEVIQHSTTNTVSTKRLQTRFYKNNIYINIVQIPQQT